MAKTFDQLVAEAESAAFSGWDFSWIEGRWWESSCPWDYQEIVTGMLAQATSLLDMGTGGGEFLAALGPHLPARTVATEAYEPNIEMARQALAPWGVTVLGIPAQAMHPQPLQDAVYPLALADGSVDLVINRHESFDAREVARVLAPGGRFVTQQVGARNFETVNRRLGSPRQFAQWSLTGAKQQVQEAGLGVVQAQEALTSAGFQDVGALVYYLKAVPWQVADFSVSRYRQVLETLHWEMSTQGPFLVESHRFLIVAVKGAEPQRESVLADDQ